LATNVGMMRLSIFQKTLLASAIAHGALAAWLLPRVSGNRGASPRGVVSLELIESVTHEMNDANGAGEGDKPVGRHRSARPQTSHNVRADRPQERSEEQKGAIGNAEGVIHETSVFIQEISRLIDNNKIYPKGALDREEEGRVVVAITLDRDGRVLDVKVEQPCPFTLLNQAALQTVQKIGRFPAIPDVIPVPLHLHIPIHFRIER
jgi:TonB family protein